MCYNFATFVLYLDVITLIYRENRLTSSEPYLSAEKRKSLQVACRDFLRLRHCVPGLFRAIREYRRGSVYLLRLISLLPFQTVSQDIR